jgi:hypothetical protein
VGLEWGPLSLVSTIEALLGRNSSGCSLERREYGCRDLARGPHDTLYPQKLALTLPTSDICSVVIVCSWTKAMEFIWTILPASGIYNRNVFMCALWKWRMNVLSFSPYLSDRTVTIQGTPRREPLGASDRTVSSRQLSPVSTCLTVCLHCCSPGRSFSIEDTISFYCTSKKLQTKFQSVSCLNKCTLQWSSFTHLWQAGNSLFQKPWYYFPVFFVPSS